MLENKKVIAFVTAAGMGTRIHLSIPKQFITVDDIPICFYLLQQLQCNQTIDEIIMAIPSGWNNYVESYRDYLKIDKLKYIVIGGKTNFDSIKNMYVEIKKSYDNFIMVLNDGDRPLLSQQILNDVFENFKKNGNTLACIKCVDIPFCIDNNKIENLNRDKTIISQTPHAYDSNDIEDVMKYIEKNNLQNPYIFSLLNALNKKISFVYGNLQNFKITYQEDLDAFKSIIHEQKKPF